MHTGICMRKKESVVPQVEWDRIRRSATASTVFGARNDARREIRQRPQDNIAFASVLARGVTSCRNGKGRGGGAKNLTFLSLFSCSLRSHYSAGKGLTKDPQKYFPRQPISVSTFQIFIKWIAFFAGGGRERVGRNFIGRTRRWKLFSIALRLISGSGREDGGGSGGGREWEERESRFFWGISRGAGRVRDFGASAPFSKILIRNRKKAIAARGKWPRE